MITTVLLSGLFIGVIAYIAYIFKNAPIIDDPDNILSKSDFSMKDFSKEEDKFIRQMKIPVYDNIASKNDWKKLQHEGNIAEFAKKLPTITFQVGNIEREVKKHGLKVIIPPDTASKNTRKAVVEYKGEQVELIEFKQQPADTDPVV